MISLNGLLVEWHDIEAAFNRTIDIGKSGLVIPDDNQFQLRLKFKVILTHESRCHGVATRQLLDAVFSPRAAGFRLTGICHARTIQAGYFRGMPCMFLGCNRLSINRHAIIT